MGHESLSRNQATWENDEGVEEWVSLEIEALPDESSQMIIAAGYGKKKREDFREWVLERLDVWMAELDVEWRVAAAETRALRSTMVLAKLLKRPHSD